MNPTRALCFQTTKCRDVSAGVLAPAAAMRFDGIIVFSTTSISIRLCSEKIRSRNSMIDRADHSSVPCVSRITGVRRPFAVTHDPQATTQFGIARSSSVPTNILRKMIVESPHLASPPSSIRSQCGASPPLLSSLPATKVARWKAAQRHTMISWTPSS